MGRLNAIDSIAVLCQLSKIISEVIRAILALGEKKAIEVIEARPERMGVP
jgi:hypothetical protein